MGVEFAHHLHLRGGGDPEETVPAPHPRVDPGDAAVKAASPVSRRELSDPLHRVALGALREQHLDGPGLRIYSQPKSEEVAVLGTATADFASFTFRRKRRWMNSVR